ncbi:MAG: TGS domain-containing protein, partial [Bacteroidales bacterium]
LNMVREVLESPDVNALEFLDKFHEGLLASEIYVFTPKGESKSLPKGATAIDFAYNIHTAIGNKAIAAKVNLKLVPLSQVLKNGDQIEIITAESQKPQREWINFAITAKAKSLIYDALKSDIKNSIKEGQAILETELAKYGVKPQLRVIKKLLLAYNLNNKEELYSKIGAGLVDLVDLEKILKKNSENKIVKYWNLQFFFGNKNDSDKEAEEDDVNVEKRPDIDKKKDYLLQENPIDNTLSYKVAECCNPIPGDAVIGFVDENNNVIVHKKVCKNAISLATRQGGKIVSAKWTKHTVLSFLARLDMKGIDKIGIVNEITKYITLVLNVNIRKIHFETHDGIFEGYIELYVHNTEDLDVLMKRIQKIKGIENIARVDIKE